MCFSPDYRLLPCSRLYKGLIISLFITCIASAYAFGQQLPDVAGSWEGSSMVGKNRHANTLELEQDGEIIWGVVTAQIEGKNQRAKYKVTGTVTGNDIKLKATKFVEKKGLFWCLPTLVLDFKVDEDRLTGKWRHNVALNGCMPGTSGKFELIRTKRFAKQEVVVAKKTQKVHVDDFEGTELVKALKNRKYYALVIGVEDYQDGNIADLDHPIADAKGLIDVITSHYTFNTADITFLKNPSRTDIIQAFDRYANVVKPTDNLLIFYAGHGIWDEQLEQGFWLPKDASTKSKANWISNGTIRDYVRAIKAKHTLLIADACFSGGILKERSAFTGSRAMLEMYKLPSRKAITSGTLKTVPDKSVFIEYLLKNLRLNEYPLYSAEQLFSNFKVAVINNSPNGQVPQYGAIQNSDDEGGSFIFLKKGL
ncbi:MAG: caspase family protein [Bacteroidota bacterium]